MPSLSLRIDLDGGGRIGPGKIALLEQVAALGSISAAGRALGMSYRRAWELLDETNRLFGRPVAEPQVGGRGGGGAVLTPAGVALIARYRAIERAAGRAARVHIEALENETRGDKAPGSPP